jgi:hypothetical protein
LLPITGDGRITGDIEAVEPADWRHRRSVASADQSSAKRKWPRHAGAKFEQGGFTSGRRKGPKTLFPSRTREPILAVTTARKLGAMSHRVLEICAVRLAVTTGNFVWHVCKKRNPLKHHGSICRRWISAVQLSRLSATLRSRKSRNTLIRFEARNSSG